MPDFVFGIVNSNLVWLNVEEQTIQYMDLQNLKENNA